MDRQTDGQTYKLTGRQLTTSQMNNRQTDRGLTGRQMDRQTDRLIDIKMDRQTGGQTFRWAD